MWWFRNKKRKKDIYLSPFFGETSTELPSYWKCAHRQLLEQGINLHYLPLKKTPKSADLVIVQNFFQLRSMKKRLSRFPRNRRVLMQWEPAAVDPEGHFLKNHRKFGYVLTLRDDLADEKTYFTFRYPQCLTQIPDHIPFEDKRLITMMVGNKRSEHPDELYSARRKAIEYFDKIHSGDFEFYGVGWEKERYETYRGAPSDKLSVIKNYRFSICYENQKNLPGYITEKIFQCFAAKNVPVYLGAPNITNYIPPECFIARDDFDNLDDLYSYLKEMSDNEYRNYLSAIENYVRSDRAKEFSFDQVGQTLANHLTQHILDRVTC